MATLPSYVELQLDGYAHQPRPGVVRTEMESGPPKQATRESRILHQISARAVIWSKANYASWLTFWETTINRVDFFDFTDPRTATTRSGRLVGGQFEARPLMANFEAVELTFTLEYWGS